MNKVTYNSSLIRQNRRIFKEVHEVMELTRNLLNEDKVLCAKIDAAYEEVLLRDLESVPEQYDDDILTSIDITKIFLKNVNFAQISEEMKAYDENKLRLEISTFELFRSSVSHLSMSKLAKSRVMNVMTKFKPLFECIDAVMYRPIAMIRKVASMRNNDLNDLFD